MRAVNVKRINASLSLSCISLVAAIILPSLVSLQLNAQSNTPRTVDEYVRSITQAELKIIRPDDPIYSNVPTSFMEARKKLERLRNPYSLLGIDPKSVNEFLIVKNPTGPININELRGMMSNSDKTEYNSHIRAVTLQDLSTEVLTETRILNTRKLQWRYSFVRKNYEKSISNLKDRLAKAHGNSNTDQVARLTAELTRWETDLHDLKDGFESLINPEILAEVQIAERVLTNLTDKPDSGTQWNTTRFGKFRGETGDMLARGIGGALSFDAVSALMNISAVATQENPEAARAALNHLRTPTGNFSMLFFGLGTEMPKYILVDLLGGGLSAKWSPALAQSIGAYLRSPTTQHNISEFMGTWINLPAGTVISAMFDKMIGTPGAKQSIAGLIESKNQFLNWNNGPVQKQEAEVLDVMTQMAAANPALRFSVKQLCQDKAKTEKPDRDVQTYCALAQQHAQLEANLIQVRKDIYQGFSAAAVQTLTFKGSEVSELFLNSVNLIATSYVAKKTENLISLILDGLGVARLSEKGLSFMARAKPLVKMYTKVKSKQAMSRLRTGNLTGDLTVNIESAVDDIVTRESFDRFATRAVSRTGLVRQSAMGGWWNLYLFMEEGKNLVDPVLIDIGQAESYEAMFGPRTLKKVAHITRCLLNGNSDPRGDCNFENEKLDPSTLLPSQAEVILPDHYAMTKNEVKGRALLQETLGTYFTLWETYRDKVILRQLNGATEYYKSDIQAAQEEFQTRQHMYEWIESCQYHVDVQHQLGPGRHFNTEMFSAGKTKDLANILTTNCAGLPEAGDGKLAGSENRWRPEDRYQSQTASKAEPFINEYFATVYPFLALKRRNARDKAYSDYVKFFKDINGAILAIGAEELSMYRQANKGAAIPDDVDTATMIKEFCGADFFDLAYDKKLSEKTGSACFFAMADDLAYATVSVDTNYVAELQKLNSARVMADLVMAEQAARPLFKGAYFTNTTQPDMLNFEKVMPHFLKFFAAPANKLVAGAANGVAQFTGMPYNLNESYIRESADLMAVLIPVYDEFWKGNMPKVPANFVQIQYNYLNSLPPRSVQDSSLCKLDFSENTDTAKATDVQAQKDLETTAFAKSNTLDFQHFISDAILVKRWNRMPDILSQLIPSLPLKDSKEKFEASERYLGMVVKIASPLSTAQSLPKQLPYQLYRTDLVAAPIGEAFLKIINKKNRLNESASSFMSFGQSSAPLDQPDACIAMTGMKSGDYDDANPMNSSSSPAAIKKFTDASLACQKALAGRMK